MNRAQILIDICEAKGIQIWVNKAKRATVPDKMAVVEWLSNYKISDPVEVDLSGSDFRNGSESLSLQKLVQEMLDDPGYVNVMAENAHDLLEMGDDYISIKLK